MNEKDNYWKFWENFRKFWKFFFRKLLNMDYFSIFSNKLTNNALIFWPFGRETQIVGKFWENFLIFWWKFYRKIEFFKFIIIIIFIIFRKFVTQNRAFGNNTIFLQQFFRFRGGGDFHPSPWLRPWDQMITGSNDNLTIRT